ncbi:MAG: hypothetical protein ACMUEM_05805 [Flavobacteriales bacterium AspAUS03]
MEKVCFNVTEFFHGEFFKQTIFRKILHTKEASKEMLQSALIMKLQTGDLDESTLLKVKQFDLMDGGIIDNQGFESMISAHKRRIK